MSASDTLVLLHANIHGAALLLPSAMIAEIVDYQTTTPEQEDAPSWSLGLLAWRGIEIPLISLENINHNAFFTQSPQLKIVVVHGVAQHDALPFWAFVSMDTPKMIRVTEDDLSIADDDEEQEDAIGAMRVNYQQAAF